MQTETKGLFQSPTVWGLIVAGAGLVVEHSNTIQDLCLKVAPDAWLIACGAGTGLLVQLAGLILAFAGTKRRKDLKGLWRRKNA